MVAPPYVVTEEEIDQIVETLHQATREQGSRASRQAGDLR
jgi:adenosylmethionine-8-amino-7-oxononanoate aminotransferase